MIAHALFENMETAERESYRLNRIIKDRLVDARKVTNPPEEVDENIEFTAEDGQESRRENEDGNATDMENTTQPDEPDKPKIYLGEGSQLSGWIPVPREIIFDEIAPVVTNNEVDDSEPNIQVNFTEDVPMSGWSTVDKTTVLNDIVPIVQEHRLDRDR